MPFGLRGVLAAACAALGTCGLACTEPPWGVHVVVTMKDDDFDNHHMFDHLTVTARIGERRADACMYPDQAVRAVALDGEPSNTACADQQPEWKDAPTASAWALEGQPRTVNVEAEGDEEVEVEVIGRLGGLGGDIGSVRGEGVMRASPGYPELRIELKPAAVVLGDDCDDVRLDSKLDVLVGKKKEGLCETEKEVDCPEEVLIYPTMRSDAISCVGGMSRVRNRPGKTPCNPTESELTVWHGVPRKIKDDQCELVVVGRLARCKDGDHEGDCELTSDCTPVTMSVWARALTAKGDQSDEISIKCLPPTVKSIAWSFPLKLPDPAQYSTVVFGLRQSTAAANEHACFLDVEAVAPDGECVE